MNLNRVQSSVVDMWRKGVGLRQIAREAGISEKSVSRMVKLLRASGVELEERKPFGGTPWRPEEDAILRANYLTMTSRQIAELIPGRSEASVENRRNKLGLIRGYRLSALQQIADTKAQPKPAPPKGYSPAQIAWARENISNPEAKAIVAMHLDWLRRTGDAA